MGATALPVVAPADSHAEIIGEALEVILSSVDLQAVLERTAALLARRFGETRIAITRRSDESPDRAQVILVTDARHPGAGLGEWVQLAGSAAGKALAERRPCVVDPVDAARPRFSEEPLLASLGYGSLVSFPLVFEGRVLGTLDVAHPRRQGLLDCCVGVAGQVSRMVAIALHNSLMVEEVRRLNRLLDRENALLREEIRQFRRDSRYIASGPSMQPLMERVRLVAPAETTVLIRGETGTGKEGLARLVHEFSPRFNRPFVTVNLGAIPEALIESELFGHVKGAFTGATRSKPGRFEQAEGGTLFLDEVGDAPLPVQVKLLRVLQEREVQRVGGEGVVRVDVRVVAATNRNLEAMVAQGALRSDLYYRLNVFPLELPPLRARVEEVRPLVLHFLEKQSALMHRKPPGVPASAWRVLEQHPWPGNVRELENFVQRALILSPGPELVLPDLCGGMRPPAAIADTAAVPGHFDDEVVFLLRRALAACGGRIYGRNGAAELLGLPPTTLQGKLRRYGLASR